MNLKSTTLFTITLLGAGLTPVTAAKLSEAEAHNLAASFLEARSDMPVHLSLVSIGGSSDSPLFYVFDNAATKGFIIISAEESTTPVMGYSLESNFSTTGMPDAMKWVIEGMASEIKASPTLQNPVKATDRLRSVRTKGNLTPRLLSTPAWSQEAPFNASIPGQRLTGCVATAMATIMKYHNFPQRGQGNNDNTNFDVVYDWDNMRTDNYRSGYSDAEAQAVATLLWHVASSIGTEFGMSSSSAYEVKVPGALSTYFSYDPGVSYKKRSDVDTQEAWDAIVRNEIDNGRPVLYCGQDVSAGHAFVCDGYDADGLLHFNWGWGGAANGYFRSTMLNPIVSRTHNYNNLNTIVYNIKPGNGKDIWSQIHITADGNQAGIGSDMADLKSGKKFSVRVGNLKNLGFSYFTGKVSVALFGSDGNMKFILGPSVALTLQPMGYLYNGYVDINNCVLPSGITVEEGDLVRIVTCADGESDWLPVAGELSTINQLNANRTEPQYFSVTLPTSVAGARIEGDTKVIPGWNYTVTVTPENADRDVITVKSNGIVVTPNGYVYTVANVRENLEISVLVQDVADVKERRAVWVETAGTLSSILTEDEAAAIKELTLFGTINASDFEYMKKSMSLTRLDISSVSITAHGSNQANALPREAFRGLSKLSEVVLPSSLNRINNGAFMQSGLRTIVIPANVKTYEYNVFAVCGNLRDIWVGRETPEFINWCVLSGVKTAQCTLHVPSEAAKTRYAAAENWKDIANIVVEKAPVSDDVRFAVADDNSVKFDSDKSAGMYPKGTGISFKALYTPDNDNRMTVYANSTPLTSDAEGNYTVSLDRPTIVHFEIEEPLKVSGYASKWVLNGKNGSIGLFSDAVNVIPGEEFVIRANAFKVPSGFDQAFWAAALTDAEGNIKEFISPVTIFTAGPADNHKMNVTCCVRNSKVREGNFIRLVTSFNKKQWDVVKGENEEIVDALPALNNVNPVYNITLPESDEVEISGVPATAVRGRDLTLRVKPRNSYNRVNLIANGKKVAENSADVNYSFVAMSDMNFEIEVTSPKDLNEVTYTVNPGELLKAVTAESVKPKVIVKGKVYASDLQNAFRQDFFKKTALVLDLSEVEIVAGNGGEANVVPSTLFYRSSDITKTGPNLREIILPRTADQIAEGAFQLCSKIETITLPEGVSGIPKIGRYASGGIKYIYRIGDLAFDGCTSLKTIIIPGDPGTYPAEGGDSKYAGKRYVAHHNPFGTNAQYYSLMGSNVDYGKVSIVVPAEFASLYRTANADNYVGNPWKKHGYNILTEVPVYSLNYDPAFVELVDSNFDTDEAVNFLGDNTRTKETTISVLRIKDLTNRCVVLDNGKVVEGIDEDGIIPVTFYNPAYNGDLAGNHRISVINLNTLRFHLSSPIFRISDVAVSENTEGFRPSISDNVVDNVPDSTAVNFSIAFETEHKEALSPRVKVGNQVITADENGIYTVNVTDNDLNVEVYAVTSNGSVLNPEEFAALDPAEAAGITSIGISGTLGEEQLKNILSTFPNLEQINLSRLESEIPQGLFAGNIRISGVVLPNTNIIHDRTFSGCTALKDITLPETVRSIGVEAFKNCESLTDITLTGVTFIGANAFDGCIGLTSITMNPDNNTGDTETKSMARPRQNGISATAFEGLNPNCMIYVDESIALPQAPANYIRFSSGIITETNPDGTVTEYKGRVYSTTQSMTFSSENDFSLDQAIKISDEHQVTLTVNNDAGYWCPLVLPFEIEAITDAEGNGIVISTEQKEGTVPAGKMMIVEYNTDENKFVPVASPKANTPYLFKTAVNGSLIFHADRQKMIKATEDTPATYGEAMSVYATYITRNIPAQGIFILNSRLEKFENAENTSTRDESPEGDENETPMVTLLPFSVYISSDSSVGNIDLQSLGISTGTDDVVIDSDFRVTRKGADVEIYVAEACQLRVYALDGRLEMILNLEAGKNIIAGVAPGIRIVGGMKIRF